MFHILSLTGNCSATGEPAGCWSVGQTCNAALARVDDFASELLAFLEAYDLKGPVLGESQSSNGSAASSCSLPAMAIHASV